MHQPAIDPPKTVQEKYPSWRVLLLWEDGKERDYIIEMVQVTIPGMNEDKATNAYREARSKGVSLLWRGVREHAEFYYEGLKGLDVPVGIEPEAV